jgi:DNA gyrase subunit A
MKLQKGDRVLDVQLLEAGTDIVIVTRLGRAIRFPESEVPAMGRVTQGVRGIGLRKDDAVVGMVVVRRDATLCTVTEEGYAKRTVLSDYPAQKRGGLGTITLDVTDKTGPLIAAKEVLDGDELMIIAANGEATRIKAPEIPVQGRATQGKRVLRLETGNRIVEVARVAEEGDGEDNPARTPSPDPDDSGDDPAGGDRESGGRKGSQLELMNE